MRRLEKWLKTRVSIRVECEEETAQIEGNALASGDDAVDRGEENRIKTELECGNEWAWCSVCVRVLWNGFEGTGYLGCCSYKDEQDFRTGGYFDGMVSEAISDLSHQIIRAHHRLLLLPEKIREIL